MAFAPKFVDLVRNMTITVGTGPIALGLPVDGYTGFAQACAAGDRFYYCIQGIDRPTEREVGRGTMQADGTIAREAIQGGLTNFRSGSKTIALVAAAEWFDKLSVGSAAPSRGELAAMGAGAGKVVMLGEAGRAGLFRFEAGDKAAKVAADPMQGVHIAPASDASGTSGAWVRQYDGPINVRWFGAKADNSSDDAPAINAAVALSKVLGHAGTYSTGGPAVFLPVGIYYCASTIDWNHSLHLFGEGGGDASGEPTTLRFPVGVTGLRLQYVDTSGAATVDGAAHSQAAGSIIENLVVKGGYTSWDATPEGEHHGLHAKVRFTARNVTIANFQGDGIRIVAQATANDGTRGNANGWNLDKCEANGCRNGLYIEGGDTNAGMSHGLSVNYNRRWGIFDSSFLGNTHVASHADGNGISDAGATPTMAVQGGKRYAVRIGQEAGAASNPPSGTSADNSWWIYCYDAGVAAPQFPAWASGIAVRSGGSYGGDNLNAVSLFANPYHEFGQGNGQIAQNMLALGGNCTFSGPWIRAALGSVQFRSPVELSGSFAHSGSQANYGTTAVDRTEQYNALNGFNTNVYIGAGSAFAGGLRFNGFYTGVQSNAEIRFTIGGQYSGSDIVKVDGNGLALAASKAMTVGGLAVVGSRKTGWASPTGTATRTTFDTASVTVAQLAQRVKALIDDLHAASGHGLIGT